MFVKDIVVEDLNAKKKGGKASSYEKKYKYI